MESSEIEAQAFPLKKRLKQYEKSAVSLKEAAQMLNCSVDTVRRAVKNGHVKAFQINKHGNYRIAIDEMERFMVGKVL